MIQRYQAPTIPWALCLVRTLSPIPPSKIHNDVHCEVGSGVKKNNPCSASPGTKSVRVLSSLKKSVGNFQLLKAPPPRNPTYPLPSPQKE